MRLSTCRPLTPPFSVAHGSPGSCDARFSLGIPGKQWGAGSPGSKSGYPKASPRPRGLRAAGTSTQRHLQVSWSSRSFAAGKENPDLSQLPSWTPSTRHWTPAPFSTRLQGKPAHPSFHDATPSGQDLPTAPGDLGSLGVVTCAVPTLFPGKLETSGCAPGRTEGTGLRSHRSFYPAPGAHNMKRSTIHPTMLVPTSLQILQLEHTVVCIK